jgi:aryl-alcohol dehydrogenase-like predicted oxidoreductase
MDHAGASWTRREFVERTMAAAGALAGMPAIGAEEPAGKTRRSAADKVSLGATKLRVPRVALGTGSSGGQVQRDMGQEAFTGMIRHAYERGLRFIDTADAYKTHEMVREAIKGLPRDQLVIQTKIPWERTPLPDVEKELDRFRKELGTDYIDIVLIHNAHKKDWPKLLEPMRNGLSRAKEKGVIRAHGVSVHGLPGLRDVAGCAWVDVALLRINHKGRHMDGKNGEWAETSLFDDAIAEIRKVHEAGKGVIGMKLVGNGDFTTAEDREASIRFVLSRPFIDAVDIGFKSTHEVDESIDRIDRALNA